MGESHIFIAALATVLAAAATLIGSISIIRTKDTDPRILAFGLAFAGGAMVYISLVEIFFKSYTSFHGLYADKTAYSLTTLCFFVGVGLLVILDRLVPNPHAELPHDHSAPHTHSHAHASIDKNQIGTIGMMTMIAITAHNIPEGMATFFSTLESPHIGITLAAAIAIHNIPEGLSIAIPMYYATGSRRKAFLATLVSAVAEPLGAMIGYLVLAPFIGPVAYGSVFGIIAGAMVYLSLDELLPAAQRYAKDHETVYGIISGMGIIALSLALFR